MQAGPQSDGSHSRAVPEVCEIPAVSRGKTAGDERRLPAVRPAGGDRRSRLHACAHPVTRWAGC